MYKMLREREMGVVGFEPRSPENDLTIEVDRRDERPRVHEVHRGE